MQVRSLRVSVCILPPAQLPVLGAVIPRQMVQLLRRQDHAAVALLILKQRGSKHDSYQAGFLKKNFTCFPFTCLCRRVCVHASRSEGVFLTSGLSGSSQGSSSKI